MEMVGQVCVEINNLGLLAQDCVLRRQRLCAVCLGNDQAARTARFEMHHQELRIPSQNLVREDQSRPQRPISYVGQVGHQRKTLRRMHTRLPGHPNMLRNVGFLRLVVRRMSRPALGKNLLQCRCAARLLERVQRDTRLIKLAHHGMQRLELALVQWPLIEIGAFSAGTHLLIGTPVELFLGKVSALAYLRVLDPVVHVAIRQSFDVYASTFLSSPFPAFKKGLVHQPSHVEGTHLEAVCLDGRTPYQRRGSLGSSLLRPPYPSHFLLAP